MKPVIRKPEDPNLVWQIFEELLKTPWAIRVKVPVLLILVLFFTACASGPQVDENGMTQSLREAYLNAQIARLTNDLNRLVPSDGQEHVCVSQPIYGLSGEYVKTDLRCW